MLPRRINPGLPDCEARNSAPEISRRRWRTNTWRHRRRSSYQTRSNLMSARSAPAQPRTASERLSRRTRSERKLRSQIVLYVDEAAFQAGRSARRTSSRRWAVAAAPEPAPMSFAAPSPTHPKPQKRAALSARSRKKHGLKVLVLPARRSADRRGRRLLRRALGGEKSALSVTKPPLRMTRPKLN